MSLAAATLSLQRRHHTGLWPLGIVPSPEYEQRQFLQSTAALPSPSLVAARAYYLQHTPPIGQTCNALQWRRSLFEVQQIPRWHSVLAPSGDLSGPPTSNIPPPSQREHATEESALTASTDVKSQVEKEDNDPPNPVKDSEAPEVENDQKKQPQGNWCSTADVPFHVPFQFSHDHLREWGYAYLGNSATADAFINAVSLRRPSLVLEKERFLVGKSSPNLVTIRARVLPRVIERKPFLIQRQFDIEELRANIPPVQQAEGESPVLLRRSSRARRSSTQHIPSKSPRRGSADAQLGMKSLSLENRKVPIHIEYAVHYLPVLATLMPSRHVMKGDTIDLPVPHPESWSDTIAYIYTGRDAVTSCMHSNILHFAGNI